MCPRGPGSEVRPRPLRYKKNLKALYIVHPTNFIKVLWNVFRPLIRYAAPPPAPHGPHARREAPLCPSVPAAGVQAPV